MPLAPPEPPAHTAGLCQSTRHRSERSDSSNSSPTPPPHGYDLHSSSKANRPVKSPPDSWARRMSIGSSRARSNPLSSAPRSDHPGGHPVDAGVEVVETEVDSIEKSTTHRFLSDRLEIIGQRHHMVAIPSDASTDVEQDLGHPGQDAGDLVGDDLGRVEMAGVEAKHFLTGRRITKIILVRANYIRLRTQAKQLGLDRVQKKPRVDRPREDRVEATVSTAREAPFGRSVDPSTHQRSRCCSHKVNPEIRR